MKELLEDAKLMVHSNNQKLFKLVMLKLSELKSFRN